MGKIQFGTDGWRAVIAEEFTFANVRKVAQAVCDFLFQEGQASKGLVVGYDTRFLSDAFAAAVAEVAAGNRIPVRLVEGPTPTPAVSYAIVAHEAAAGIMITASHNPAIYNGVKLKAAYGGSATEAVTRQVESILLHNEGVQKQPLVIRLEDAETSGLVRRFDAAPEYLRQIERLVDPQVLGQRPLKIVVDAMYGAGSGYLKQILAPLGHEVIEIRSERNPSFPGIHPEPIPINLAETMQAVQSQGADLGLITDGDADRVGVIDAHGRYVDAQREFALLLQHLYEDRGWRGAVVKTFAVTEMIDRLADRYQLRLHKRPVGFKYVCELAQVEDVLIGGEESGGIGVKNHIPERDGILCSLLIAEMVAQRGKPLHVLVDELMQQIGRHVYRRGDLRLSPERKEQLLEELRQHDPVNVAGFPVREIDRLDGTKFLLGDPGKGRGGWLLIRPSGTEPVVRVYAEMSDEQDLEQVLRAGIAMAMGEGGR